MWYKGSFTEADVTLMIEREVKLRFDSPEEARAAILAAGATPLRCRRLQEDALLDADDESLRRRRCVLRVRTEAGRSLLTFKGPAEPGTMKIRAEYETVVGDGEALQQVLEELGRPRRRQLTAAFRLGRDSGEQLDRVRCYGAFETARARGRFRSPARVYPSVARG